MSYSNLGPCGLSQILWARLERGWGGVVTAVGHTYHKPLNISTGLIFVGKHFLVGLYMGGGRAYIRGGLYTDKILC